MKIIGYAPSNILNPANPYRYKLWELTREPKEQGGRLKWKFYDLVREEELEEDMVCLPPDFVKRNSHKLYQDGDLGAPQ